MSDTDHKTKQIRYIPKHTDFGQLQEDEHSAELGKVLRDFGGKVVDPYDFLRDLYPAEYLEVEGDQSHGYHGNPMVTVITSMPAGKDSNGNYHRRQRGYTDRITRDMHAIKDDLHTRSYIKDVYISECAYLGNQRRKSRITHMYGVAVDLDYQTELSLWRFLTAASSGDLYPMPAYIVISGTGVHLWYLFAEPLDMYHGYKMGQLYKRYADLCKEELIKRVWNPATVLGRDAKGNELGRAPQIQSIAQSYRMPGTPTKKRKLCTVYRMSGRKYGDFDDLLSSCNPPIKTTDEIDALSKALDVDQGYQSKSGHNLAYWAEHNPDWYQRRIVEGKRPKQGHYALSPTIYNWYIDQTKAQAAYGHRYWCMWCIAVLAKKCGVSYNQLRTDLQNLMPELTKIKPDAPMEDVDLDDALIIYHKRNTYYVHTSTLEKMSGIMFDHYKRNGLTRAQNLQIARITQAAKCAVTGKNWRDGNGRKPKKSIVQAWRAAHPDGSKNACIRDTGLSKPTVYKWWD